MSQRSQQTQYPERRSLNTLDISTWAQYLRDDRVFEDVKALLLVKPEVATLLQAFLLRLDRTDVSKAILERTRIHFALKEIASKDNSWGERIRSQAAATLHGWQAMFGDLDSISPDPWAPGNPMDGIFKLKPVTGSDEASKNGLKDSWIIASAPGPEKALSWGHNGFHVGQWWINAAAAFRDGIIRAFDGVTASASSATAVVMCANQEGISATEGQLRYSPCPHDPCSTALLRNLADKNPVRVLRSYTLRSPFCPRAGLRYDGLYIVKGYSLTYSFEDPESRRLQYTFDMRREHGQAGLTQALSHPNSAERDFWDQYQRNLDRHEVDRSAINDEEPGVAIVWGLALNSMPTGRQDPRDSGYLSG